MTKEECEAFAEAIGGLARAVAALTGVLIGKCIISTEELEQARLSAVALWDQGLASAMKEQA